MQYSAVQCSTVQNSTVLCSAVQCSTVLYSAVQYITIVSLPRRCSSRSICQGGHDGALAALSEATWKALPTLVAEKLAELGVTLSDAQKKSFGTALRREFTAHMLIGLLDTPPLLLAQLLVNLKAVGASVGGSESDVLPVGELFPFVLDKVVCHDALHCIT